MISLLLLSFATVLIGPVLYYFFDKNKFAHNFLDTFVLISVFGLAAFHVLPESIAEGGSLAIVAALVGFMGPIFITKIFKKSSHCDWHHSVLSIAALGLLSHSILDGLALSSAASLEQKGTILALAVILHRLPEGIGIWRFVTPRLGVFMSFGVLGVDLIGTATGFFFGAQILTQIPESTLVAFQALMAGTLLHVIFHRHHIEPESHTDCPKTFFSSIPKPKFAQSAGALLGFMLIASLWAFHPEHSHDNESHAHKHEQKDVHGHQ